METKEQKSVNESEIEIRLSDILQFLKSNRRLFFIGVLLGIAAGGIYSISKPNVYTAQATVMPEFQAGGAGAFGDLSSLIGLAGISVDKSSTQDAIRPDLYPNVLQSIPFALHLLKQPVYSQKLQVTLSLQAFIERMNEGSIFNIITSKTDKDKAEKLDPKGFSQAIQITKEQQDLIKLVQTSTGAVYDKKTGILTISATEQDPVVAATIARLSLEYLTNYIITYRTEKARNQVIFLEQRVKEAQSRYQSAEYALANYRDRNRNLLLQTAKIDEQRLQANYLLEQSVFSELSKQLEQAKIKVQEQTPVFKILEPPTIPLVKSGPKRTLTALGFGVAGAFICLLIAIARFFRLKTRPI